MAENPLAGVVGHPVSHSLSPQIFALLSKRIGTALDYRRVDLPPGSLDLAVDFNRATALFRGWNVTIPHKHAILAHLDHCSPEARALGAVNVVDFSRGRAHGHNTDVMGIRATLAMQGWKPKGRSAVIYGAGGAAAAVGWVLGELKCPTVYLIAREGCASVARARALSRRLGKHFPRTRFLAMTDRNEIPQSGPRRARSAFISPAGPWHATAGLYVNATPLGMQGYAATSPARAPLNPRALAFDLVYRPLITPFLRQAQRAGLTTVGGLDMLVAQAIGTWEIWFGRLAAPERQGLHRYLYRGLSQELRRQNPSAIGAKP